MSLKQAVQWAKAGKRKKNKRQKPAPDSPLKMRLLGAKSHSTHKLLKKHTPKQLSGIFRLPCHGPGSWTERWKWDTPKNIWSTKPALGPSRQWTAASVFPHQMTPDSCPWSGCFTQTTEHKPRPPKPRAGVRVLRQLQEPLSFLISPVFLQETGQSSSKCLWRTSLGVGWGWGGVGTEPDEVPLLTEQRKQKPQAHKSNKWTSKTAAHLGSPLKET